MASSRSKNTYGNYNAEQLDYRRTYQHTTYLHGPNGVPVKTYLPGNGLIGAKCPLTELSHNARDIEMYLRGGMTANELNHSSRDVESFLYGIRATDLVNPRESMTIKLKSLKSLDLYSTPEVIMPDPLVVEKNQRPPLW